MRRHAQQVGAAAAGLAGGVIGFLVASARARRHGVARLAELTEQLEEEATRDPGSGLRNEQWAREQLAPGTPALLVDLVEVSGSYGRMGPTERRALVAAAAARLTRLFGTEDVARVDRGHLLVVLDDHDTATLAKQVLEAFTEPLSGAGGPARVGINVAHGVVVGDDALADLAHALLTAARTGPDVAVEVSRELSLAANRRAHLERDLLDAVSRDELDLAWQPIVDLETGDVAAAEALLRWRRAGDDVSPADFVPVAEASGAIREIGSWVLDEACRQLAETLADADVPDDALPLGLHVNVSPRQLEDPLFAQRVATATAAAGLDRCALTIEVTEHVLANQPDAALVQLQALAALGVRVAIDDFGTGYSSLAYLARMPVDVIKVDRAFLPSATLALPDTASGADELSAGIFRLVSRVADVVVAEGVEDDEQRSRVHALGATHAQGYLFGRPTALRDLVRVGVA